MCSLSEHAQPPYFYLLRVSVCANAALKGQMRKRGTALPEIADLYAPQGVDLGGGGSPSRRNDTVQKKVACAGNIVKHSR